jgi:hypothetical protein
LTGEGGRERTVALVREGGRERTRKRERTRRGRGREDSDNLSEGRVGLDLAGHEGVVLAGRALLLHQLPANEKRL